MSQSYTDHTGPKLMDRKIVAKVRTNKELYLVDTAFESFVEHINNSIDPMKDGNWDIEIELKMTSRQAFPEGASEN